MSVHAEWLVTFLDWPITSDVKEARNRKYISVWEHQILCSSDPDAAWTGWAVIANSSFR